MACENDNNVIMTNKLDSKISAHEVAPDDRRIKCNTRVINGYAYLRNSVRITSKGRLIVYRCGNYKLPKDNPNHCNIRATANELEPLKLLKVPSHNHEPYMHKERKGKIRKRCNVGAQKRTMSTYTEDNLLQAARRLIPSLYSNKHKGQDGRIGVFGGSMEYSGAPFYAGMSALRTGADLVHIFCSKEASNPIKSYSPDLIVHPILDDRYNFDKITHLLENLHVLLIGPGLGRDPEILNNISDLINYCRKISKPLVLDADALFLVSQTPTLIQNYPEIVLTPNAMEYSRLVETFLQKEIDITNVTNDDVEELAQAIGPQTIILLKGREDIISSNSLTFRCSISGSGRRSGGQGDLLSGALSVFLWWAKNRSDYTPHNVMHACYGASRLIRETNAAAFSVKHRGMLASDMIDFLAPTFNKYFEIDDKH